MTRVLIVEDSPTQAAQLRSILEREGFAVEVARNGGEGLVRCQHAHFDVVLSDIMMPELSGYELCRRLKTDCGTKDIPVVLLTTLNDPMDIITALECGAENFITKPYTAEYLLDRVRTVLANKSMRNGRKVTPGVEIVFLGKRFTIDSEKEQILDLLIASFEDVIRANQELQASKAALQEADDQLRVQNAQLTRMNKELDAFVYSVSHDLKEPLRGIEAFSGFLRADHASELDQEGQHYLEMVHDSAGRMRHLIDDLLSFARVGRQQTVPTTLNLQTLLGEVEAELRFSVSEAGGRLVVPSDLPSVTGYPFLLRQLFMNLIGNALKYRRTDTPPQVAIAWRPLDTGVLEITVADNGIGIPPEHRERVFGLFQRLHRREEYPGTGVGLALCKRIADEHGGTVAL
jgi:two-component system sensor histidine kinase/response regulator